MRKALAIFLLALALALPALTCALAAPAAQAAVRPTLAERRVLAAINRERSACGLATLRFRTSLIRAARWQAHDLAARRLLSHLSSNGWSVAPRVRFFGYTATECTSWSVGENLARARAGTDAARPRAIVALWMLSPAHRDVLLTPRFRDIGVGIVRGDDGLRYFTVDFGRRVKS